MIQSKPNYKEAVNENYLKKLVKARGGECIKLNPAWNIGIPDRLVLLPGPRVIFIELKRPRGGRVSKAQIYWRKIINVMGFEHHIAPTKEDIERILGE